jgi:YD repeat-containing protein
MGLTFSGLTVIVPAASRGAAPMSPANSGAVQAPAGGPERVLGDGEVPSLRTETSRTYRSANGVYQARVFSHPVNYRDSHGSWARINNTLVATSNGWHNTANPDAGVQLPSSLADAPVTVSNASTSVGFALDGATGSRARVHADTATYPDALAGVGVVEQTTDIGLKESLVLANASAASTFTFDATLSAGLRLRAAADGGVDVVDATGKPAWHIPAATMTDATGAASTDASLRVSGATGAQQLTVSVDQRWLDDPDRVFPVVVDPTVTAVSPSQETYVYSGAPTTSYGAQTTEKLGRDAGGEYRLLVKYDVASALPHHIDVLATTLQSNSFAASNGAITIGAYQLNQSWTTGATWNTYDGTHAWASAGGDVTGSAIDSELTPEAGTTDNGDWYYLQPLTSGWVTGDTANNGLELKESGTTGSVLTVPQGGAMWLSVSYVYRTGVRSNFTYYTRGLDDHAALRVNMANGNLVLQQSDVSIPGVGVPLRIDRYYNSQGDANPAAGGGFPLKWTQGVGRDVKLDDNYGFTDPDTQGELYYGPSGDAYWFNPDFANRDPDSDGNTDNFTSPPGINADLNNDEAGPYRKLTFHNSGEVQRFGDFGLLNTDKDRNGNTISFSYSTPLSASSQLTSVTDTQGRSFSVGYNGSGLESGITDANLSPSRSWSYGYTSGYLTSYTDPASKTTSTRSLTRG